MPATELTTEVPTLAELQATDLSPFDGVYLGHPFCRIYRDNLMAAPTHLSTAVGHLKDQGLQAYVSTDAAPTTATLPHVRDLLQLCVDLAVDGVEVQNLGVLRLINKHFPELAAGKIIASGFINLYTVEGAKTLAQHGVSILRPAHELNLADIDVIRTETSLAVELLVHGEFPLGITDRCLLLDYEEESGLRCPDICRQEFWLKRDSWAIRHLGTVLLSGNQMCMLEHLPDLLDRGYRRFRTGALTAPAAQRGAIGRVYRAALDHAANGTGFPRETLMEQVAGLGANDLCNGFYFGQSGHVYVNHKGQAVAHPNSRED